MKAVLALLSVAAFAGPLPPRAQRLLEEAQRAKPQRFQYALDCGVRVLPASDGRSFYLLWNPDGGPLIATLHGSSCWAGTYWMWFCGGRDPGAGHGGHQTPAHIKAVLAAFGANLALRTGDVMPETAWEIRRDPEFEIPGAEAVWCGRS